MRECMYAFRPVTVLRRWVEWKNVGIFVGNAFMHSDCVLFQNWLVEWQNVRKMIEKDTVQQTVIVIQRFGTDKSVPYEHIPLNSNLPVQ